MSWPPGALAGPVWEREPRPVFGTESAYVLVLDLSPSMNAVDLRPSRLARARFEILDLLTAAEEGQTALIAFGPEPFVVTPLTSDIKTILAQVPYLTSDLIPVPGPRQTARALGAAGELLARSGIHRGEIILLADDIGAIAETWTTASDLVAAGHRISVLGVGARDGATLPLDPDHVEPASGTAVTTARFGESALRELARRGQGRYVRAEAGDADTRALMDALPRVESTAEPDLKADEWREEGPWLLLALLPLAALAFRRGWLVPLVAAVLVLPPPPAAALDWSDLWWRADQQAVRQLESGDAAEAARRLADPAWRAAAHYRAGEYEDALAALADQTGIEADYNRGNAWARAGRLEEAIAAYERVLAFDPEHADARHNRDLVRSLLERGETSESDTSEAGSGEETPSGRPSDAEGESGEGGDEETPASDDSEEPGAEEGAGEPSQDASARGEDDDPGGMREGGSDPSTQSPGADSADVGSGASEATPAKDASSASSASIRATPAEHQPPAPGTTQGASDDSTEAGTPPDVPGSGEVETTPSDGDARPTDPADLVETETLRLPETEPGSATLEGEDAIDPIHTADIDTSANRTRAQGLNSDPGALEREHALEAQLRRVPDDPGGLLKQRFMLQHLRRAGRLP